MARTEAVLWWPSVAEALVLICAAGILYPGRGAHSVPPDASAAAPDAADDEASEADAVDDEASEADATEADPDDADPDDADPDDADLDDADPDDADPDDAEARAANHRASAALDRAESDESNGDYLECVRELAPITWRLSVVSNGDLIDAVEERFKRCDDELASQYKRIEPGDCQLEVPDAIAITAAPPGLAPRAAKAACLALVPGSPKTQPPNDGGGVCPRVALVWSAGGLHRRELAFAGGPLDDTGWCCHLDSVAAGTLDGKTLVRVGGVGHPCGGGTAYEATDALYEWNGASLASPIDISIDYH